MSLKETYGMSSFSHTSLLCHWISLSSAHLWPRFSQQTKACWCQSWLRLCSKPDDVGIQPDAWRGSWFSLSAFLWEAWASHSYPLHSSVLQWVNDHHSLLRKNWERMISTQGNTLFLVSDQCCVPVGEYVILWRVFFFFNPTLNNLIKIWRSFVKLYSML